MNISDTTKKSNGRRKMGRPRLEFDLATLEGLARIQCTVEEIAGVFGCSRDTVHERLAKDETFAAAYEKGREQGKASLRRMQWKSAENGAIAMQIWLGKQYLDQREKQEISGDQQRPVSVVYRAEFTADGAPDIAEALPETAVVH